MLEAITLTVLIFASGANAGRPPTLLGEYAGPKACAAAKQVLVDAKAVWPEFLHCIPTGKVSR